MRKEGGILIFILITIFSLSFISSDFSVGNLSHSITTKYLGGDFIKGWVNISFKNELGNTLFGTNFGSNYISVSDLVTLNKNNNFIHTCIPTSCENGYSAINQYSEKDLALVLNDKIKTVGLNFSGVFQNIISSPQPFAITITSDAPETDTPQLYIHLGGSDGIDWQAYDPGSLNGNLNLYYINGEESTIMFSGTSYCEKMDFPIGPQVVIGANVFNESGGGGSGTFKMSISDGKGTTGTCDAYASIIGGGKTLANCTAYTATGDLFAIRKNGTYSVCITANSSSSGQFRIYYEPKSPANGYTSPGGGSFDFNIFGTVARFAPVGSFTLNDTEIIKSMKAAGTSGPSSIEDMIKNYINNNYAYDCSLGCAVPITITAAYDQNVNVSNVIINYFHDGVTDNANNLYDLTTQNAVINSPFDQLYLDSANFSVPKDYGTTKQFIFFLNGTLVFSENISINLVPTVTSVSPVLTIAGYPTNFSLTLNNVNSSVSKYKWDFGDGTTATTTGTSAVYTYGSTNDYDLNITLLNSNNSVISTGSFSIHVDTPQNAVNLILSQKINDLNVTEGQVSALSAFYQNSINSVLNLSNLSRELNKLEDRNNSANSSGALIGIMGDLINLKIPGAIITTGQTNNTAFYIDTNIIDLNFLKTLGNGTVTGNKNAYIDAILAWNSDNMDTNIDYQEISAVYETSTQPLVDFVKLDASEITQLNYSSYLVIKKLDNMKFASDYSQSQNNDVYYIKLNSQDTKIIFSTTEQLDFSNIPAYISPEIGKLTVIQLGNNGQLTASDNTVLIIALIVVFGFILYVLMQIWYKKRYEDYLFRNKNDLYNLVSYIQNSKKGGTPDKEIGEKLRKSGWRLEQISYVMRKYVGKKIPGLIDFNFSNLFKIKKKNSNIPSIKKK
jgi:hypothetical protein